MAIRESFVQTPYGTFHAEEAGRGSPVLLIHGGTASAREWRPVLEGLGDYARCVAIDRLGCGLSDRSRSYDRETLTESLFACADALGWNRFGVVGQSYGGFWSLSMAFAKPERISRMVLVDSAGGPMSEEELAERRARNQRRRAPGTDAGDAEREQALDRTIAEIFANPARVPPTYRDDLRWQMERADPAQMQRASDQFDRMAKEDYAHLGIPTLVVWGEADSMVPVERGHRLAAAIPGARYVGLPGVGHTCQIEAPAEFVAAVAPFLKGTT